MSVAVSAGSRHLEDQTSHTIQTCQSPSASTAGLEQEQRSPRSVDAPSVLAAFLHNLHHDHPHYYHQHLDGETGSPKSAAHAMSMSGIPVSESPPPMDLDAKAEHAVTAAHLAPLQHDVDDMPYGNDGTGNDAHARAQPMSLSYPGSIHAVAAAGTLSPTPSRGLSYPMLSPGGQSSMISGKKHKCPHCDTEFTRHHNLKSHLLTHSHEKPYVCQDCNMRFRRLHDLKRHSKLHSGEKPHICPKCERKFARGDALARHAKGAGGCAGRRSSMGSFVDGEDMDPATAAAAAAAVAVGHDSVMDNVVYANEDGELTEEERHPHSRAYPSVVMSRAQGQDSSSSSSAAGGPAQTSAANHDSIFSLGSERMSATGGSANPGRAASMFSPRGMTESPKALSPGLAPPHQFQQSHHHPSPSSLSTQQFSRRRTERTTVVLDAAQAAGHKFTDLAFATVAQQSPQASQRGNGSNPRASDSNNMFSGEALWSYMHGLQDQIKALHDRTSALERAHQTQLALVSAEFTAFRKEVEERQPGLHG